MLKDAMDYIKELQKAIEVYGTDGVDLYNNLDGCYNAYPSLKEFGDACNWITDSNNLEVNAYLRGFCEIVVDNKGDKPFSLLRIYQTLLRYAVKCHAAKLRPTGKYGFLEDTPIFRAMSFLNNLRRSLNLWNQLRKPFSEMDDAGEAKKSGTTINNTTNNYVTNNYDNRTVTNNYGIPTKEDPEKENGGGTSSYSKELVELFNGHTDSIDKLIGLSDDEIASKIKEWSKWKHIDGKPICKKVEQNRQAYADALQANRIIGCKADTFRKKLGGT